MNPCFAIIDSNTLNGIALRGILQDIFNGVEIHIYKDMDTFIRDSNRHFVHFFVSSEILFNNADEFEYLKDKATILSNGRYTNIYDCGFNILDTSSPEQEIISSLLHLNDIGKSIDKSGPEMIQKSKKELSAREKEVLALMVKGFINKEIADHLHISVTTVIFHRNNICEKLQTRSLGKLTVFAVLSGIVGLNEIQASQSSSRRSEKKN